MRQSPFKPLLPAALLAVLAVPATVHAELYLGAGVGQSEYQDLEEVELACTTLGAACDADDSDTGFKLFAGYRILHFIALEAGYIDFGESVADATAPVPAQAELSAEGGYISLLPQVPIGPFGIVFGRIGLSAVDAALTAAAGGRSIDDSSGAVGVVFGAGAELHLTPSLSLRGEWERHSFDEALDVAGIDVDAPDIELLSASLVLRF